MGEFVKKTLMGYKEVPDGQSDPECTHVILTETEYAKLQRKISDAEQLARTTKYEAEREVDSARRDADYKIRQNVEKANQTIKRWSEALDAERAESGHLRSLNENLLRIARERANADRKLKPKKEHTGYSVVFSTEKEHRYGKGKNMTRVMLWETVIQSPYSIDLPEGLVRKQITDELTRVNEDGESLICRIGIDSFYPGSYAAMLQKRKQIELFEESEDDEEPEKPKGSWNKRFHANLERMKSGDICDVAAVARNLILQDRRRHISSGERRLLDLAKQILVSELVYACNKTPKEIENWLTSVLSENAFAH